MTIICRSSNFHIAKQRTRPRKGNRVNWPPLPSPLSPPVPDMPPFLPHYTPSFLHSFLPLFLLWCTQYLPILEGQGRVVFQDKEASRQYESVAYLGYGQKNLPRHHNPMKGALLSLKQAWFMELNDCLVKCKLPFCQISEVVHSRDLSCHRGCSK